MRRSRLMRWSVLVGVLWMIMLLSPGAVDAAQGTQAAVVQDATLLLGAAPLPGEPLPMADEPADLEEDLDAPALASPRAVSSFASQATPPVATRPHDLSVPLRPPRAV